MESVQAARRLSGKLLATREGTIALGVGAAVLAGIFVLVYVNQYRKSLDEGAQPVRVLVARQLIERGTPGDVVGSKEMFQFRQLSQDSVPAGVITDPATLRGRVAVNEVFPGQQLTLSDFGVSSSTLGTQLVDEQRAISIPVDATHGLVGQVEAGDHVDVLVGLAAEKVGTPKVKTLFQDIPVLVAPTAGGDSGSNITLRVPLRDAAKLALASENGTVWIVLRPRAGAKRVPPSVVTVDSLSSRR